MTSDQGGRRATAMARKNVSRRSSSRPLAEVRSPCAYRQECSYGTQCWYRSLLDPFFDRLDPGKTHLQPCAKDNRKVAAVQAPFASDQDVTLHLVPWFGTDGWLHSVESRVARGR